MSCTDCTQARADMWHGYRAGCAECQARALARGPLAAAAINAKPDTQAAIAGRQALADAIRRAMPSTDPAEARRMVWAWWKHDHPKERQGATC